jgi:hypothetical protein
VQQVQHAGAVPRLGGGGDVPGGVVGEPDGAAVAVLRRDLAAALVPVRGELPVQRVELRRAGEDRPPGPVAQVVLTAERGLGAVGTQALAHHDQAGAVLARQLGPAVVHGVEELPAGLAGPVAVDQVGDGRREVGVLDGHGGAVPPGQVLDGGHRTGVDPPRPRGGDDDEDGAVQTAGAGEVVDGDPRAELGGRSGVEPGVGAHRLRGRSPGERRDVGGRRPGPHERATLPAEGLPADQGPRSSRQFGRRGLDHPLVGPVVAHGEGLVGSRDELVGQDTAEQERRADRDDRPPDRPGGACADPSVEQQGDPGVDPPHRPGQRDQEHEESDGDQGHDQHGQRAVRGRVHQLADPALPVAAVRGGRDEGGERDAAQEEPRATPDGPRLPIDDRPPGDGDRHPDAVAEGGGYAADQPLGEPGAREQ